MLEWRTPRSHAKSPNLFDYYSTRTKKISRDPSTALIMEMQIKASYPSYMHFTKSSSACAEEFEILQEVRNDFCDNQPRSPLSPLISLSKFVSN